MTLGILTPSTQKNGNQYNNEKHNDTQNNGTQRNIIQIMTLSIMPRIKHLAEHFCCTEC
jgi:hypothetical protein